MMIRRMLPLLAIAITASLTSLTSQAAYARTCTDARGSPIPCPKKRPTDVSASATPTATLLQGGGQQWTATSTLVQGGGQQWTATPTLQGGGQQVQGGGQQWTATPTLQGGGQQVQGGGQQNGAPSSSPALPGSVSIVVLILLVGLTIGGVFVFRHVPGDKHDEKPVMTDVWDVSWISGANDDGTGSDPSDTQSNADPNAANNLNTKGSATGGAGGGKVLNSLTAKTNGVIDHAREVTSGKVSKPAGKVKSKMGGGQGNEGDDSDGGQQSAIRYLAKQVGRLVKKLHELF